MLPPGSRTSDYDFELPPDRIAQQPLERRDASRLLVVDRRRGEIRHHQFSDIVELVAPDLAIEILEVTDRRTRRVRLLTNGARVRAALARHGHVPLPPYITRA